MSGESTRICAVAACRYAAVTDYEGFDLCLLHDHASTRGILDRLMLPAAYWAHDRPIVVPCRELRESDLSHRFGKAICASEDPRLADVPDSHHHGIYERFSLS
jgi:hypothetical protein